MLQSGEQAMRNSGVLGKGFCDDCRVAFTTSVIERL